MVCHLFFPNKPIFAGKITNSCIFKVNRSYRGMIRIKSDADVRTVYICFPATAVAAGDDCHTIYESGCRLLVAVVGCRKRGMLIMVKVLWELGMRLTSR